MARVAHLLWSGFRLPLLAFLVVLEPVVRTVLSTLALLGIGVTLLFGLVGPPNFPFWTMLSISLAFGVALMIYEATVRWLSS